MILWCVFGMRSICYAVITRDFCLRGSSRGGGAGGGVADTRKERRKEWAWWSSWLFHLLWHREELLNAIWVSALYGTTFMKYISPLLSFSLSFSSSLYLSLPPSLSSNWRCNKGVWGQWFFKVRPHVCLTLMFSLRHMNKPTEKCPPLQSPIFCPPQV